MLMTVINSGHAEAATRSEAIGSVSDLSLASFPAAIDADHSGAGGKLTKITFESEILRGSLIKAVRTDNAELTKKLIKLGADANSRTSANGWSALHYAVRNGNAEIVQLLLKDGADPNCLGTIDGQKNSPTSVRPLFLAEAALDLVSQVPTSNIEETLHQSGLDDPALVKSMKDPNASIRYKKVVDVLTSATTKS
jgi:ankyrin repeat protein